MGKRVSVARRLRIPFKGAVDSVCFRGKRLKEALRLGQSENLAQLESNIQAANLIFEG